jgi:ATP-dependent Clp protease protease subunit
MPQYIAFIADVQTPQIAKLREALTNAVNTRVEEIQLFISSSGGNVSEGLNIAAFMKTLPVRIVTHNIGQIDSIANVIFAAGSPRYAIQTSSFLFHGISWHFEKLDVIESQIEELRQNSVRSRENVAAAFAAYTGLTVEIANELMVSGATILTAAQARERAIINEIRNAEIPQGAQVISIGNA